jgi:serine/threonine protein kinase
VNKRPNQNGENCFAIVLEYAGGGELFDFVAETGKFSERVTRSYFHQMMNGLHYMHDKGYAHRDIKPENLLLTMTFVLKIADFGFSCLIRGHDGTGVLKTKLGTEGYMAPEIALKNYDGRKTDIFAAGVILFIMYAGNPPFEKATITDPYYKLIKEKRFDVFWNAHSRKRLPTFFTDSFKDLVQKMISYVPS